MGSVIWFWGGDQSLMLPLDSGMVHATLHYRATHEMEDQRISILTEHLNCIRLADKRIRMLKQNCFSVRLDARGFSNSWTENSRLIIASDPAKHKLCSLNLGPVSISSWMTGCQA
jgi:hypothetical protein